MKLRSTARNFLIPALLTSLLVACGGGGSSPSISGPDTTAPDAPSSTSMSTAGDGSITVTGLAEANSEVTAIFPDGSEKSVIADSTGFFSLTSDPLQPSGSTLITSTDANGNTSKSTSVTTTANKETIKAIYLTTGTMPELPFEPSLGVNTEGPQGGADTAGMPMPFVDIFRTARPFKESQIIPKTDANGDVVRDKDNHIIYIQNETTYDENGWPTTIDPTKVSVSSSILQGTLRGAIPEGKYTVLYEGSGKLNFSTSGSVLGQTKIANENKYLLDIQLHDFNLKESDTEREKEQKTSTTNQIYSYITDISSSSYIKNIRIVMPGGTCINNSTGKTDNPFIRVDETDICPNGTTYESFAKRLETDRNAIIFNPDYLMFLRNFKVIRMMNLMEASLKHLCYTADNCPAGVGTWDHRAKMDDAVWGGNDGRTADEDHKGVPIKVMTTLANTLKRDIWVNMPHISSDDYVSNYAKQVYAELDPSLKVYLEYSNEVWNNGFAGHAYTTSEGNKLNLGSIPADTQQYCDGLSAENREKNTRCHADYYSRLRFYSQRAVEIFKLWKTEFSGSNSRLVRVLGSFIGDKILTQRMLEHVPTDEIDVVAIAPYFFGCPYQSICKNAPMTLRTATTVDDIFDALDQSKDIDVKSIDGTIAAVKNQLTVTNQYGIKLVSYEGGQHLVTGVLGDISNSEKVRLRKLFNDANRDPRMKERYIRFLNGWKDLSNEGTSLFTLYTLPQSFYRYGNFGLKEHLNKSRAESPKFDGVMSFQEAVGNCWWDEAGCTP